MLQLAASPSQIHRRKIANVLQDYIHSSRTTELRHKKWINFTLHAKCRRRHFIAVSPRWLY